MYVGVGVCVPAFRASPIPCPFWYINFSFLSLIVRKVIFHVNSLAGSEIAIGKWRDISREAIFIDILYLSI